jgi:hypothetical protein
MDWKPPRSNWIPFNGKVSNKTSEYVDLIAADGSNAKVRVFKDSYQLVGEEIFVCIGGHAEILRQPDVQ